MIKLALKKALDATYGKMELDVSFHIKKNSLTTIYGESGAGKTSILRMISGLMEPDAGHISINNKVWYDHINRVNVIPQKRKIGYVFQDYALFPNMTVKENLSFALIKGQDPGIISELLDIIELTNLKNRKSDTLSLQDYILKVHKKYKLTTILVSHDLPEIFKLSDKILLLAKGKIERSGTPSEIFLSNKISGKYRFTGTIIEKSKNDVVYVIGVLVGNNLIKVIATEEEGTALNIGDKVMVVSKAFNPLIIKMNNH
jgi:molybdate transport system ATP-binding protein